MSDIASIAHDLIKQLSPDTLISDPVKLAAYGRDFWGQRGIPGLVVSAMCTEDVIKTLQYATFRGIPVIPRAAGTNIGGGFLPTPSSILLDMRRLNRILQVDQEHCEAIVEPGVLNGALQTHLAPLGFRFSPDPASASISTIGGNIAENAGGPRCLKYGVTFHHVAGIECVLPGGHVLELQALDTGPDLLGVVIGSEGTLGVVTQARLKLSPLPQATRTLFASFDQPEKAGYAVSALLATGLIPATIEYLDQRAIQLFESYAPTGYPLDAAALIIDVDGSLEEVEHDIAIAEQVIRTNAHEVRRANDDAARLAIWRGRLQAGQALAANGQNYHICDTTVPRSRIPNMQRIVQQVARNRSLTMLMIGHAGDGNVHPVILYDGNDAVAVKNANLAAHDVTAAALELGGTITGEHGIGSEKIPFLQQRLNPAEIAAMRVVKHAFDPTEILNPGILFPKKLPTEPLLPALSAAFQSTLTQRLTAQPEERMPLPPKTIAKNKADIELDTENFTILVQADMTLGDLQQKLDLAGYSCLLTQSFPKEDATIAIRSLFLKPEYRMCIRDSLLEVDATLVDGHEVRFGSNVMKDVAGYDMKRLFIGSGSTFGHVEKARFQIRMR